MAKASKTKKKKITLTFEGTPGAEIVVAGSFNGWTVQDPKKAKKMKEEGEGRYTINMFLPVGEYEYKFYQDGEWFNDPVATEHKPNSFGTFNSVIKVA